MIKEVNEFKQGNNTIVIQNLTSNQKRIKIELSHFSKDKLDISPSLLNSSPNIEITSKSIQTCLTDKTLVCDNATDTSGPIQVDPNGTYTFQINDLVASQNTSLSNLLSIFNSSNPYTNINSYTIDNNTYIEITNLSDSTVRYKLTANNSLLDVPSNNTNPTIIKSGSIVKFCILGDSCKNAISDSVITVDRTKPFNIIIDSTTYNFKDINDLMSNLNKLPSDISIIEDNIKTQPTLTCVDGLNTILVDEYKLLDLDKMDLLPDHNVEPLSFIIDNVKYTSLGDIPSYINTQVLPPSTIKITNTDTNSNHILEFKINSIVASTNLIQAVTDPKENVLAQGTSLFVCLNKMTDVYNKPKPDGFPDVTPADLFTVSKYNYLQPDSTYYDSSFNGTDPLPLQVIVNGVTVQNPTYNLGYNVGDSPVAFYNIMDTEGSNYNSDYQILFSTEVFYSVYVQLKYTFPSETTSDEKERLLSNILQPEIGSNKPSPLIKDDSIYLCFQPAQ